MDECQMCTTCKGEGLIKEQQRDSILLRTQVVEVPCPDCNPKKEKEDAKS